MKRSRLLWTIMLVAFVLTSSQGYARTPDRALENPLFLADIGETEMLYAGYAMDAQGFLISYAEYDEFANGYGAVTFFTGGQEETGGTISFVAVKEYEHADLAVGIYRGNGETYVDVGVAYEVDQLTVRAGLHEVPLTRWDEKKDQVSVSLGGSVDVTDTVQLGVDLRSGDPWHCNVHSQIEIMLNLTARISVGFYDLGWQDAGVDLWATYQQVLFHLGYTLHEDLTGSLYLGLGFQF